MEKRETKDQFWSHMFLGHEQMLHCTNIIAFFLTLQFRHFQGEIKQ